MISSCSTEFGRTWTSPRASCGGSPIGAWAWVAIRSWSSSARRRPDADFRYRIYNADGGEVEQCGNGARCFVKFVRDRGYTSAARIRVETAGGLIVPELAAGGEVTVDMGVPRFAPAAIPFLGGTDDVVQHLEVDGQLIEISVVSMGNPHAVQVVADVDDAPVATQGPKLEHHARFPQRVNAGYMQVVDRATIRLRVWERGAGETPACGTGACAAVVTGMRRGCSIRGFGSRRAVVA